MAIHLGMKSTAALATALAGALALGGCSGDDDDRERVDAVEAAALGAVDGVLHEIAETVGLEFGSGNHFFNTCGESYAPRGVKHRAILNFELVTELPQEDVVDTTVDLLQRDGWETETISATVPIVIGTKDENTLRLEIGGLVVAGIGSDCVETSNDVAREYDEVADADIEWK